MRLGLRLISGLHADAAKRLLQARAQAPQHRFASTEDLALRAGLERHDLQTLAAADALAALSGHRRQQMWDAAAQHRAPALLRHARSTKRRWSCPRRPKGKKSSSTTPPRA